MVQITGVLNSGYYLNNKTVVAYENSSITVYPVSKDKKYNFSCNSYRTSNERYTAVAFSTGNTIAASGTASDVVISGIASLQTVNDDYIPSADGYVWVVKFGTNNGELVVKEETLQTVEETVDDKISDIIDATLTESGKAADANETGTRINGIMSKLPIYAELKAGTLNSGFYLNRKKVTAYNNSRIDVYAVTAGHTYRLYSANYKTGYANYTAVAFSDSDAIAANNTADDIVIGAIITAQEVDETYIPALSGYIWVVSLGTSGVISVYDMQTDIVIGEQSIYPLKGKTVAVLGDSIMQNMDSHTPWGQNVQTYEYDGTAYSYDDLDNIDGELYTAGGNKCDVINSDQTYYDSESWDSLKNKLRAGKVINCAIGGSIIDEGAVITAYPGVESGTYRTNSLPNQVRWLLRRCTAESVVPDAVVIWMGTNGLGRTAGSFDDIMALSYSTLADNADGRTYRQTVNGGLRFAIETIVRTFPYAQIYVLTPIQATSTNRDYDALVTRAELMIKMARRFSCQHFVPMDEIGIYSGYEDMWTRDGLHPNDAGKIVLTNYLSNRINHTYYDKR